MTTERLTLDAKGVAEALGVGVNQAYTLMHDPTFPSFRVGRRWLVSADALKAWLQKQSGADCEG
ncbi:MAG: helix-turn-helix domain-containing protein [Clostridiales bacterium]|nr:helix-turn-helix domain-containing protein [Clostridiales bacterium]